MIQIEPIAFPLGQGTATNLAIQCNQFTLGAKTAYFTYYLQDGEGGQTLASGTFTMTEEQYNDWGTDDNYVVNLIVQSLPGVALKVVQ